MAPDDDALTPKLESDVIVTVINYLTVDPRLRLITSVLDGFRRIAKQQLGNSVRLIFIAQGLARLPR